AAYVVPVRGCEFIEARLRAHLAERCRLHMLPARIVVLDSLPLLANGKVDYATLRSRPSVPARAPDAGAPATKLYALLKHIWCEELGVATINGSESFFELGGDSLRAVRIVERVLRATGMQLASVHL